MTKLILFTGKGGVGKSTSSAATALYHSRQGLKTLLVSSDPAHSTDDTVGTAIGDKPREISPNLWAMNINAVTVTQERRNRMQEAFRATFGKMFPSLLDPENEGLSSVMSINNAIRDRRVGCLRGHGSAVPIGRIRSRGLRYRSHGTHP